jgi:hypothetical protein
MQNDLQNGFSVLYFRYLCSYIKRYKEGLLAMRGRFLTSAHRPQVANKPFFLSAGNVARESINA